MNPAAPDTARARSDSPTSLPAPFVRDQAGAAQTGFPKLTLLLTGLLFAMVFFPPVKDNPRLVWTYSALAGVLLTWQAILWAWARSRGRSLRIEYYPVKSHWVQALAQSTIFLWWGLYVDWVLPEIPMVLSQMVFLYTLDALLSWSRGRNWRLGFGPMPIVISTNLLLWFRHDYYYLQFLMLTTGALAKNFLTWERDGRQSHIFNPSAFGQFVFAVGLIATATTKDFTIGREIASTFDVPHMLIVIFLVGLVVQSMFHVTVMTIAAVVALYVWNQVYYQATGLYFFVNINIAAPIFLGVHLLITDPATSPKTLLGRTIFGFLYGTGYCILFRVLDVYEVPLFWDKLLPVPILNLCVPLIDRFVKSGFIGKLNRSWESLMPRPKLNMIHMGCWIVFFGSMVLTGYIEAPHPGNSIPFWKQAWMENKPHAGHALVLAAGAQAEGGGSGAAYNELGLICMEGKIVNENHGTAARYFAKACELGNLNGCANLAIQYLFLRERRSEDDVMRAFDHLEEQCNAEPDWGICYLLGAAYEQGRGRPWDKKRAIELYERCGPGNLYASKGLARIALSGTIYDLSRVATVLEWGCESNDVESCWYLAYMYSTGNGVARDQNAARQLLEKACMLGSKEACEALQQPELPRFKNPVMVVPGWSSAFPM